MGYDPSPQQQMIYPNMPDFPAKQEIIHEVIKEVPKADSNIAMQIITLLSSHINAWVLLACLATGGFVLAGIVFKTHIKKKLGGWLKWADKFINS